MDEDAYPFSGRHTHGRQRWMRHWMRHTAGVPKGFLRHRLLRLLNEKPMSGSEIMSEIERQTQGYWKPSPGSIYPLLAWLQDKGHIREAPEQEPGIKRYALTEQGKTFLKEQQKVREELDRRFKHLREFGPIPALMGPIGLHFGREDVRELRTATRDLATSVRNLFHEMRREYSREAAEEAKRTLEEAAKKIQDITRRLQD